MYSIFLYMSDLYIIHHICTSPSYISALSKFLFPYLHSRYIRQLACVSSQRLSAQHASRDNKMATWRDFTPSHITHLPIIHGLLSHTTRSRIVHYHLPKCYPLFYLTPHGYQLFMLSIYLPHIYPLFTLSTI